MFSELTVSLCVSVYMCVCTSAFCRLQLHLSCEDSDYVGFILLIKLLTLIALSPNVANKQRLSELSGEEFARCSSPNGNYNNSPTFHSFYFLCFLIDHEGNHIPSLNILGRYSYPHTCLAQHNFYTNSCLQRRQ